MDRDFPYIITSKYSWKKMHFSNFEHLDTFSKNWAVLHSVLMNEKNNNLFDLEIKGQAHSNLIFISNTLSCPHAYIFKM